MPRRSTRAAPSSADRNAVSWVMISSGQAIRVVATRPIRTNVPFVPYVPVYELQPLEPPTLAMPNTAVSSVPSNAALTVPGAVANESTFHVPSIGLRGAASNSRIGAADRVEDRQRVPLNAVEAAGVERRQVGGLEGHRLVAAGHERRGRLGDEQRPAAGAVERIEVVAAGEPGHAVRREPGVRELVSGTMARLPSCW